MIKGKTIIITIGPLETLNEFAREASKGLEQNGINTVLITITGDDSKDVSNIRNICTSYNVIGALTMNNIALLTADNGNNIWDLCGIKIYDWLVDHPINYSSYINMAPVNAVFLCIDRTHVDFIKKLWPDKQCYFLPHAGTCISDNEPAQFEQRDIDICYFGSIKYDVAAPEPRILKRLYEDSAFAWMAEKYISDPGRVSYLELFEEMMKEFKVIIDDKQRLINLMSVYYFAWNFGVTYYKQYLIKALAEFGLNIHVFGNNWEDIVNGVDNITYHGLITPQECVKYMNRCKIVLNNMPGYIDGSHERVFNAMMAGAVCCSDYSKYLGEQFDDLTDIVFYDLKNLQKTALQLKDILIDQERWKDISSSGRSKVLADHRFSTRMLQLEHLIELP